MIKENHKGEIIIHFNVIKNQTKCINRFIKSRWFWDT